MISFFASSILFGQDNIDSQINNSSTLKSYAFAPIISDTTSLTLESLEIPKITGWDIGGQLALSLLSGTIFSIGGALIGDLLSSGSSDIHLKLFMVYLLGIPLVCLLGSTLLQVTRNMVQTC